MSKMKTLRMQIRSAQNVGKVWIRREKSSRPHLGPSQANFVQGPKKSKNMLQICLFSLVGQWAPFTRFGVICWCHLFFIDCFHGLQILTRAQPMWRWCSAQKPKKHHIFRQTASLADLAQNSMIFINLNALQMAGIWDRFTIDSR